MSKPMKRLIVNNDEFDIVDDESRNRVVAAENRLDDVEDRLVGENLILNSDFIDQPLTSQGQILTPIGWTLENCNIMSAAGIYIQQGNVPVITSPIWKPAWRDYKFPVTLSVEFYLGDAIQTGSITIYSSDDLECKDRNIFEFESGKYFKLTNAFASLGAEGCRLQFSVSEAAESVDFFIRRIKVEYGETATPILPNMKDASTLYTISGMIDDSIASKQDNLSKGTVAQNTDLNAITTSGHYWLNSTYTHMPHTGSGAGVLEVIRVSDAIIMQRYTRIISTEYQPINVFERFYVSGTWYEWKTILVIS